MTGLDICALFVNLPAGLVVLYLAIFLPMPLEQRGLTFTTGFFNVVFGVQGLIRVFTS